MNKRSNLISPNLKLSSSQRRVALSRALDKQSAQPQQTMPMQPSMPMEGIASGIANSRLPQPLPNAVQPPTAPLLPSMMPNRDSAISSAVPPTLDTAGVGSLVEERPELSDVHSSIQNALIADQLWKDSGDTGVEVWQELKKGSKGNHLDSARDYFISSFVKYKEDPVKFKKSHPQEARLLKMLAEAFEMHQTESIIPEVPSGAV